MDVSCPLTPFPGINSVSSPPTMNAMQQCSNEQGRAVALRCAALHDVA